MGEEPIDYAGRRYKQISIGDHHWVSTPDDLTSGWLKNVEESYTFVTPVKHVIWVFVLGRDLPRRAKKTARKLLSGRKMGRREKANALVTRGVHAYRAD